MIDLPPVLVIELLKIKSIHPWVFLVDFTLPDASQTFYYAANNENVVFGGNTYLKGWFQLELPTTSSKGKVTTWKLRIPNVRWALEPYLWQYDGLKGSPVKIRIVNLGYLSANHSELEVDLEVQQGGSDARVAEFVLGGPNFLTKMFPFMVYTADWCPWVVIGGFKGEECLGSGDPNYPWQNANYTAATSCDGTLNTCRYFGNSRRYGGKKGLSQRGIRIVP